MGGLAGFGMRFNVFITYCLYDIRNFAEKRKKTHRKLDENPEAV